MKSISRLFFVLGFTSGCLILAGCGNNTPTPAVTSMPYAATTAASSCGIGSVYTTYGCLSQGICPVGQGQYGSQCIPGTGGITGVAGMSSCTTPGTVYVANVGCLPQGSCPMGQAYYNGTCVPGTMGYGTNGYSGYPSGYSGYPSGYSGYPSGYYGH